MQPYQEAGEEQIAQRSRPFKVAAQLATRAMPFLNTYIPAKLAIKGLSKVDSRLGKFFDEAQKLGYGIEQIREFMSDKFQSHEKEQQQPAKENRNIIEQYSPELHQFLTGEIQKGRKPVEAGVMAQYDKQFSNVIKKLMKDHKTSWSDIIQSIYGTGETAQSGTIPTQSGATQQKNGVDTQLVQIMGGIRDSMNRLRGGQ